MSKYEAEPICSLRVPLAQHHLRRHVLRSPADAVSELPIRVAHLRQPEVGDLDVSVLIQQYVLRLQVAVDDIARVQVLQGQQDL